MKSELLVSMALAQMSEPDCQKPVPSPIMFNNFVDEQKHQMYTKNEKFLLFVVNLHRMLGQTYGGWQASRNYSRLRRVILQSYEIGTVIVYLAVYWLLEDTAISRLFETNTRKVITAGIIRIAGSLSFLQMVMIKAIYFFNGERMLDSLRVLLKGFIICIDIQAILLFSFYFGVCTGISSVMVYLSRDVQFEEVSKSVSVNVFVMCFKGREANLYHNCQDNLGQGIGLDKSEGTLHGHNKIQKIFNDNQPFFTSILSELLLFRA